MGIFHLHINDVDPKAGRYSVYAQEAKDDAYELTFERDKALKLDVEKLHERSNPDRLRDVNTQLPICARIGEKLFNSFIATSHRTLDRYREYQKTNPIPRMALHLPPSLYDLPWEVLRDPEDPRGRFVSLLGSLIRCDKTLPDPRSIDIAPEESSLSLLFIVANPYDQPIDGEITEIRSLPNVKFISVKPATYSEFMKHLNKAAEGRPRREDNGRPVGFVFLGHGSLDTDKKVGQLVFVRPDDVWTLFKRLRSDPKPAHSVCDALGATRGMRLAFICACESAWVYNSVDFKNSIVGAILDGTNLAYVIGAQTRLDITAAEMILEKTLVSLDSLPLDRALTEARKEVRGILPNNGREKFSALDWWVPVLYAKTTNFQMLIKPDELHLPELADANEFTESTVSIDPLQDIEVRPMVATLFRSLKHNLLGSDREQLERIGRR